MSSPDYKPVLSNGLGVESVAILLRWLLEPETRDFALSDLTIVTAMVGAEWPDTADDFEKHMLPLFREHGVRFVQLARKGHLEEDGIVILLHGGVLNTAVRAMHQPGQRLPGSDY